LALTGCLDVRTESYIEGWAWDSADPAKTVTVTILYGGAPLAQVPAAEYRADLRAAGIGEGRHAYRYVLKPPVENRADLSVVIGDHQQELHLSSPPVVADYQRYLSSLLSRGLWCIDHIQIAGSRLIFDGWAFPPPAIPVHLCAFLVNGRPCHEMEFPLPSAGLGSLFPYVPESAQRRFRCAATISPDDGGVFELGFGHVLLNRAFHERYNHYFTVDSLPLPEPARRRRVHGSDDEGTFRLEGFSAYCKLDRALWQFGKSLNDFPRILDWGCGAGRVIRYFGGNSGVHIHGMDIDLDNLDWCRQNLPFATFGAVAHKPPQRAPAELFDLTIGVSVVTHLPESIALDWLAWLKQALRPSGLALLTVLGEHAWARNATFSDKAYRTWQAKGILDELANSDLHSVLRAEDRKYYTNTLHTHQYLAARWSQFFNILDVIPGYIGNHQDLVIMTPR
jgi:SAM-dependent methyltransferase